MHWLYRKHVEAAERVFYVNHSCYRYSDCIGVRQQGAMNGQHNVEVFVLVSEENFIVGDLKERKYSNAITRHVFRCWLTVLNGRQLPQVLESNSRNDSVAKGHAGVDPSWSVFNCGQKVAKGGEVNGV